VLQPANKGEARTAALTAGFSCLQTAILGATSATKTSAQQAELQMKGTIAFNGNNTWSHSAARCECQRTGKVSCVPPHHLRNAAAPWLAVKVIAAAAAQHAGGTPS
jgi:hypothetical protein